MTGVAKENFEEEFELNEIRQNANLNPLLRMSKIEETKKSFYHKKKNSSFKTIINITNNMIGSSVLIFPLVFMKYGIVNSTLILILMGAISCETCLLEVRHVKMDELDLPESIKRILGIKWFYAFGLFSFAFNSLTVIIYFVLMNHLIYAVFEYFLVLGWEVPLIASSQEFTFSKFSLQYVEIIFAFIMMLLYSIKNLRYLLKICQWGIIGIFMYVFFLFYKAIENIVAGNVIQQNLKFFSPDFATLGGIYSLAFFVHNNLITIVKTNQFPEKNRRDVILSFILTGGVYLFIGLFGAIAIAGLTIDKTPELVLDIFGNNIFTILIDFVIFSQMGSVSPLNWYIGRTQALEMLYGNNPTPPFVVILLNVIFVVVCLIVDLLRIDITMIISLNGAVCGYLMLYIIPIKLHLNCLYDSHEKNVVYEGQILMNNYDYSYLSPESPATKMKNNEEKLLIDELKMSRLMGFEMAYNGCNSAHLTMIKQTPKISRYIIYGLISIFGALLAIWEIYDIVRGNY